MLFYNRLPQKLRLCAGIFVRSGKESGTVLTTPLLQQEEAKGKTARQVTNEIVALTRYGDSAFIQDERLAKRIEKEITTYFKENPAAVEIFATTDKQKEFAEKVAAATKPQETGRGG